MKKRLLPFAVFFLITSSFFAQVWEVQTEGLLPSNYSIMNLSIVDEDVVWAVALDYNQWVSPVPSTHLLKVIRTTDGGENWSITDFTDAPGRMTLGIHALDENTAMLSTNNFQDEKGLYRTTNGGDDWTEVLSGHGSSGRTLFFNALEGVCIHPGSAIARSNDGGENWTLLIEGTDYPTFLSNEDHLNSPTNWAIIGDKIWIGTTKGRIYKSTDKGVSWTVDQATNANDAFASIAFINSNQGLSLVGDFNTPSVKVIRTSDGGENWEEISNSSDLGEILAIPSTNSFIGTTYSSLTVWSSDLGVSWDTLENDLGAWSPAFSSPETGWISCWGENWPNDEICKWIGPAPTPVTETAIGTIKLSPNPATDFIYLTFPIATEKPIDIQLYTITGQLLLTTNISEGEAIPVDHMPPGLYHVKLLLDGKSYNSAFVKQ